MMDNARISGGTADPMLGLERVREVLQQGYEKPLLLIDPFIIREKYRRFARAMPRVRVHYAVKANPDPRVVSILSREGAAFEIASKAELDLLLSLGESVAEAQFSTPVKPTEHVVDAIGKGVVWFALDCVEELHKLHTVAPRAKLSLRIEVPDFGSDFPLSSKFGAKAEEIDEILAAAAKLGANLCGVTFHVGSQCRNVENWQAAIEKAKQVFRQMRALGLVPELLNIGGGFPVRHTKPIPSIEVIGATVNAALADVPISMPVIAEPGRFLVSDSACLVCRVIGVANRGGQRWLYLDTGIFGGLFETTQGLQYVLDTDRAGGLVPWRVAGPTCDSDDVLTQDQHLPDDMQIGDFIYVRNAGAYTTAYASRFNGFPVPEVRLIEPCSSRWPSAVASS